MKNFKMLILGSDYVTYNVVKEAHKKNMYVIVTDLMQSSPTKDLADESWMISTTDIDMLEKKCIENNVNCIMFGASDFNISNARKLCKRLNLPIYCDNDFAWHIARNKRAFKDLCIKHHVPVSTDYYLDDDLNQEDINKIVYPVVVKPSDKSGNRGMSFCNNAEELITAYHVAREISDESIVVERKLKGKEYNIHYLLSDSGSTILYFNSTHHEPGEDSNLYSFKCTTSEYLDQYMKEVDLNLRKMFADIGCNKGIVWVDAMRDDDGHFYLLEMGYRFGGVMTYVPYELVTGFSTINWMIDCACGIDHTALPNLFEEKQVRCAGSYHLFSKHDDVIYEIDGLEKLNKMDNIFIDMPKREQCSIREKACFGLIGIYGENVNSFCETLKYVNDNLNIKNKNGENLFIKYDDYDELIREYNAGIS